MIAAQQRNDNESLPSPESEAAAAAALLHFAAGKQLLNAGNPAGALVDFDRTLALCSTFAEAWLYRGKTLEALSRDLDAYDCFAQAAILAPAYREAQDRLFVIAQRTGRPHSILIPWIEDPKPGISARISWTVAHLFRRRDERRAQYDDEASLRDRLIQDPRSASLASELGVVLLAKGRAKEGELFLRYALALEPWCGEAAALLARHLADVPEGSIEAASTVANALAAGATHEWLPTLSLWFNLSIADWKDYERLRSRANRALKRKSVAYPFEALVLTDDPNIHRRCAVDFAHESAGKFKPISPRPRRNDDRRLTIGYLSSEFGDHAVATLFAELFELHDRGDFRIHAYSTLRNEKGVTRKRIIGSTEKFVDIDGLPPRAAAEKISEDQVDILVDLTGYTANLQPRLLAHKPAPIQVNYLGYPGTLGHPAVDYAIVDPIVAARESDFTEALVYLPECYQVNDRKRRGEADRLQRSRSDYGLPDSVVFCCFNELRKITPPVFATWMGILRAVPDSILWMLAPSPEAEAKLRAEARKHAIAPERLLFGKRCSYDEHLTRYRYVDAALDTYPYGSHTTGSDALWMGCPLVTTLGLSFPNRVAASLVSAAGLPELVTKSWDDYAALAIRIGREPKFRASLRAKLEANRDGCVLFDTPRSTRLLEWAFRSMWEAHAHGRKPTTFHVPAEAGRPTGVGERRL